MMIMGANNALASQMPFVGAAAAVTRMAESANEPATRELSVAPATREAAAPTVNAVNDTNVGQNIDFYA